jgi:hypothetical protein
LTSWNGKQTKWTWSASISWRGNPSFCCSMPPFHAISPSFRVPLENKEKRRPYVFVILKWSC